MPNKTTTGMKLRELQRWLKLAIRCEENNGNPVGTADIGKKSLERLNKLLGPNGSRVNIRKGNRWACVDPAEAVIWIRTAIRELWGGRGGGEVE